MGVCYAINQTRPQSEIHASTDHLCQKYLRYPPPHRLDSPPPPDPPSRRDFIPSPLPLPPDPTPLQPPSRRWPDNGATE
ncbi:MAG: hypothetical protein HYR94_26225 [Chloroflexi bacterium]|nr:hypothetical protein [Chloroflexota bacterium]